MAQDEDKKWVFDEAMRKLQQFEADPMHTEAQAIYAQLSEETLEKLGFIFDDPRVQLILAHLGHLSWEERDQILEMINLYENLSPTVRSACIQLMKAIATVS